MEPLMPAWYEVANAFDVPSPALLVYPARAAENIRRMVSIVGDVARLRPHVKTHKLPEVLRMHLDAGIRAFKAATPAECEMAASAGAPDVLFAYQPVGPNVARLLSLARRFRGTRFSAIVDDERAARALGATFAEAGERIEALVDIDCGMHRTGIPAGPEADALYRAIASAPGLVPGGLHAYDGHLRQSDLSERTAACEAALAPVRAMRDRLARAGLSVPRVVAGGTPSFPVHARHADVECSPGTCVFWDAGYAQGLPDLDFLHAVVLLARVVSKPGGRRLCLDLGHKAVASENPHPRAIFLDVPDAVAVGHSEEHLVLETDRAPTLGVGDALYAIPWHVCPTVALHDRVVVVREGRADDTWTVTARARSLGASRRKDGDVR
jgi:D-serine deaminase-like pyridoxal phosphate-dependent protein